MTSGAEVVKELLYSRGFVQNRLTGPISVCTFL